MDAPGYCTLVSGERRGRHPCVTTETALFREGCYDPLLPPSIRMSDGCHPYWMAQSSAPYALCLQREVVALDWSTDLWAPSTALPVAERISIVDRDAPVRLCEGGVYRFVLEMAHPEPGRPQPRWTSYRTPTERVRPYLRLANGWTV